MVENTICGCIFGWQTMEEQACGYIEIPIEVIAKFGENGELRPLKMMYGDEIFVIERVLSRRRERARAYSLPATVFCCVICGQKRELKYYDTENRWSLTKYVPYRAFD